MGREFGVSKHQIFMIVSGRKWSHIKTDYQPIQRITLTQAIADRIRLMRNKGSTARAIAEHFGVGLSAVKHVICGDRW
jgi:DNA invertase Pin-like site-specific DNA recombinase